MAAINQPAGPALTVRDAAVACRLSPRTLRRKLTAGSFPNAYKTGSRDPEREGIWMIPVADLEAAELHPTLVHPTLAKTQTKTQTKTPTRTPTRTPPKPKTVRPEVGTELEPDPLSAPDADGPTVLELVRSDRFGRLRAELAEAVAAAEIALLRAEAERWRVLADERAQALDRADTALKALTTAMGSMGPMSAGTTDSSRPAVASPAPAPAIRGPEPVPTPPPNDIVAVSPLVRAEAMRYTASLRALHEMRKPQNKWWQFWRG